LDGSNDSLSLIRSVYITSATGFFWSYA